MANRLLSETVLIMQYIDRRTCRIDSVCHVLCYDNATSMWRRHGWVRLQLPRLLLLRRRRWNEARAASDCTFNVLCA